MAAAARVGDITTHGGTITGPGAATVLIGGMPAAIMGDLHICAIVPTPATPHLVSSPFVMGSATVLICGKPAVRTTDICLCGAGAAVGCPTVIIGG
ncbi:PaaR repeat-containing protein [Porphyromonadaceae bacterium COT-184 OH4590]|nr:PaaR repeat-containing protein [Porphyromonadaceae bacterium COT-184 OH4590]